MAASKVNVKFVVLLSAVLGLVFIGVALAFVYTKLKSGDRYARLAEAALAAGDYAKADTFYARAVGKDQSNVEWLVKWRDTRRKKVPETQTAFSEDYGMYVSILRTLANAKRTDVEAHRDYLDELYSQAVGVGFDRGAWRNLISESNAAMRFFEPEKPPALRRYRGVATLSLSQIGEQVSDPDLSGARDDLEAAIKANPADEIVANDLAVLYREAARKALAAEHRDEAMAGLAQADKVLDDLAVVAPQSVFAAASKLALDAANVDLLLDRTKPDAEVLKARDTAMAALRPRIKELGDRLVQSDATKLRQDTVQRYVQLTGILDPKEAAAAALKAVDHALTGSKTSNELMLLRSQILTSTDDLQAAIAQYQVVIDQPKLPVGLAGWRQFDARRTAMYLQTNAAMQMAMRAKEEADRKAAITMAGKYREQLARNVAEHAPELLLIDGKLKYLDGDWRGAQLLLSDFIKTPGGLAMQVPEARLLSADIAAKLGQTGLAIDELEKVLAARPGSVDLMLSLAQLYTQVRQPAKAAATYKLVLNLDPTNATALEGQKLLNAVMDEKSVKLDDPVMQLLVEAERLQRGTAQKLGDEQAALDLLEKNIATQKGDPRIVIPVARIKIGRNDLEGAKAVLKAGLALRPDDTTMKDALSRLDAATTIEGVLGFIDSSREIPLKKWWSKHQAYLSFDKRAEAKTALAEFMKLRPEDARGIEAAFLIAIADNQTAEAQRLTDLAVKTDADRAGGDTYRARLLIAKNDLKEASALLERAAQRGNATAPLLRLFGLVQLQTGRDQGLLAIKRALELNPTDLVTIKTYLVSLAQLNRQAEALALARESQSVAQQDPEFLSAWLALEADAGNRAFAVERREQIYKRSASDKELNGAALSNAVALAALYCDNKQWDKARALIEKLREGNKDSIQVTSADARWHADKGDLEAARAVFVNLIEEVGKKAPPDDDLLRQVYLTFGQFMIQRGRADVGFAAMRQAERLQDPKTMTVSLLLGDTLLGAGKYGDAELQFRKVLDANVPDPNHQIIKRLIESYVQQRKLAEAEQEFVKLGANADDDVELMAQRSHTARGLGDLKRARDILDRAVVKFPNEALPYLRRARLLMVNPATVKDALADLDTAIKINPNMWQARRTRGTLLVGEGRTDEGVKDLMAAVESNPAYEVLRLELIDTLLNLRMESEAVDVADAGLKPRPNDARLIGSIADRFAGAKYWTRALRYYKMLWQQLADESSAVTYINALLNSTPPGLAEADAVLATPALNADRSPSLLLARAMVRMRQGQAAPAKADAVAAFDRCLGNPAQLGQWALRLRRPFPDPKDAMSVYAAVKAPASMTDWIALQKASLMLEDPATRAEGISILEGLLANSPDRDIRLDACRTLPSGYQADNKWQEALAATMKGLELKPDDVAFNNNAAYFLSEKLNRAADGLPYADRAARADPQNDRILDTLAGVHWRLGARDKAMQIEAEAFRRARNEADKATWALTLARWRLESKDKTGATGLLNTLREMLGDTPGLVAEFKSKVDQLEKDIQGAP